jgi:hypothetical protein
VARVSKFFGAGSQATVCTPTAVAAARGTGFRVTYDARSKQTYVAVVDGTVQFRTSTGEVAAQNGQMTMASGFNVRAAQGLSGGARTRIDGQFQGMSRFEKPESFLVKVEKAIANFCDPALQLIGLAPGAWSYNAGYAARRGATMVALKRIQESMISMQDDQIPTAISLVTLEELNLDPKKLPQILDALGGNMLESYQKLGPGNWVIRARSRDKKRTLYELTPSGPREIKE